MVLNLIKKGNSMSDYVNSLNRLNELAKNCNFENINKNVWILEDISNKTSTTTFFDKDSQSAYTLNPIILFRQKKHITKSSVVPSNYKGLVALHRSAISIISLSRVKNEAELVSNLFPVIQAGIIDIMNQVGDIDADEFYLTMESPDGTFFRYLDNFAAVEIHLSLHKK